MIPYAKDAQPYDDEENYDLPAKDVDWYHRILLNRTSKVAILGLILSILGPILIYVYILYPSVDYSPSDGFSIGSCLIPRISRVACGPSNVTEEDCHSQCCYDYELHTCFHRFPSRFTYISEDEWVENNILTPRVPNSPFKNQENVDIKISIDEISASHLAITLYDAKEKTIVGNKVKEKNYIYHVSTPEINIAVNDTSDNVIFNTVRGPIIAADNNWEIVFKLTDETMYGLGDIPLSEGAVKVLYNHENGWNGIPLIFSKINTTYHGLLIDVVEPTEVKVTGDNQIVLRSLTKKALKLHFFVGPEPKDIMRDIVSFIGSQSVLEYWMLGLHVCSDISTSNTYDDLVDFLKGATEENMPFESHCGVKPVVFQNDKCDDQYDDDDEFTKGAALVKSFKKRFVPHISPYIHYIETNNDTTEENSTKIVKPQQTSNCSTIINDFHEIMLKTSNNSVYKGLVGNETVFYPDYEFVDNSFLKELLWKDIKIDGISLENSWPLDQSAKEHNETYNILPYMSRNIEEAFNTTPQWNVTRPNGDVYMYTHNQYGKHFANAFRRLTEDMPLWISNQWFGRYIVNKQSVTSSWLNLQRIMTETALGGVSGNWLWSIPICGDTEQYDINLQTQLCTKWYQASTYLPLIRVHSKHSPRHPLAFNGNNRANIIKALKNRLSLLPYIYTTLKQGPLLRPMFYQFPSSEILSNLTSQFSVGEDLIIVPNLLPSQSHVHLYMPPGQWYELWSGLPLDAKEGDVITMTTTDADFLVVVREGAILVMQKDARTTAESTRLNSDYTLTIALSNTNEEIANTNVEKITYQAEGKLFISDNMTIIFKANETKLTIKAQGDDFKALCDISEAIWARKLSEINVFGLEESYNNFDHIRKVQTNLDLCNLEEQSEIVFDFIS